jgi:hypothetical protein
MPGRLIHLVKVKQGTAFLLSPSLLSYPCFSPFSLIESKTSWCSSQPRYFPINSNIEEFREIVVSSTMGADHFPDQYYYQMKKIRDYFLRSGFEV